ncbi:hypothetical protein BKA65DRAFT_560456 [Rhexocercosporidium sp. MPI-PUGE-AT-0058]|nr:hypothetical protein BKA65DRAFT_560456 [Rhexocercosporidium sp. MPI-PUGE-AT-0058]
MENSSQMKRRQALTDTDRLCIQKRNKTHPPEHQSELATWYKGETGRQLTQGRISKVLSSHYDYLDKKDPKKDKKELQAKRTSCDWPELEATLFEWQQRIQDKKAVITGDLLKA